VISDPCLGHRAPISSCPVPGVGRRGLLRRWSFLGLGLVSALGLLRPARSRGSSPTYTDCDALIWRLETAASPPADGIMQQNKGGFREIGSQRGIARYVAGAIALNRPSAIQQGLEALEKTFAFRDAATGFPYMELPNATAEQRQLSRLQSTVFFQTELLQAAHMAGHFSWGMPYRAAIGRFVDLMKPEAEQVIGSLDKLMVDNIRATNRLILMLRFATLSERIYGISFSRPRYIRAISSLQTRNGAFLESGGGDVSYQGAGLLFAGKTLLVRPDDTLLRCFRDGMEWMDGRISERGELDVNDSSRTAGQDRTATGAAKRPNQAEIAAALVLGAALLENDGYLRKAYAVSQRRAP
jgi:hypothetical protein